MSQISPETASVRFGFSSYKGGKFELIAINIKTGEEITLEGQLRPDQTLEQIDKVLPTCVYVNAVAQTGQQPVAYRWRQPGNKHWIYDPAPEWIEDHKHEIELEPLYTRPSAALLSRARQFVADAGCDGDDSDVNAARNELLADMDAALSVSSTDREGK
jgi:hypothetical protein